MKSLAGLKPQITIEPLPAWIMSTFAADGKNKLDRSSPQDVERLKATIEKSLWDALMPFQKEGVQFALERKGRAYVADDMGLGKTLQALAIASAYRGVWPLLIVCPSSMRFSWRDAILKWLPQTVPPEEITVVTTTKEYLSSEGLVNIMSYDILARKQKELENKRFKFIIMDESHFLKNHKSNRYKVSENICKTAPHLILLSGTPALSRPIELYSQLSLVAPKLIRYATSYGMRYCDGKVIQMGIVARHDFSGSSNMEELRLLLKETCLLRRLKTDVLNQLPAKQRQTIELDPSAVKSRKKDLDKHAQMMGKPSLSQSERHSILLQWYSVTGQAKVKAVCDYLKDLLEGEKKFLCFAHHKCMLDAIEELLMNQKVRYIRIDGTTASEKRNEACTQFQLDDQTKVAVLSIKAANAGLTLTAAQLVVFAELFWNPGILTQAEDRAHRIGQNDTVIVQYLVAKGTADDELWPMLQRKLDVLNQAGLSKDDFKDSDAKAVRGHREKDSELSSSKITDFFTESFTESDIENWENDEDFLATINQEQ